MTNHELVDYSNAPIEVVQEAMLKLLTTFAGLCDACGWNYWLGYGTLLGAVRHGGFIPWDDDADVYMFREDFDEMIAVLGQVDLGPYALQCMSTDERYYLDVARLRLKGTFFPERTAVNCGWQERGVYLDIYPLEKADKRKAVRYFKQYAYRFTSSFAMHSLYGPDVSYRRADSLSLLAHKGMRAIAHLTGAKPWLALREKARYVKPENVTNDYRVCYLSYVISKGFFKSCWFDETERVSFEGRMLNVFGGRDEFLGFVYGDYMTLPPESERVVHRFLPNDESNSED